MNSYQNHSWTINWMILLKSWRHIFHKGGRDSCWFAWIDAYTSDKSMASRQCVSAHVSANHTRHAPFVRSSGRNIHTVSHESSYEPLPRTRDSNTRMPGSPCQGNWNQPVPGTSYSAEGPWNTRYGQPLCSQREPPLKKKQAYVFCFSLICYLIYWHRALLKWHCGKHSTILIRI